MKKNRYPGLFIAIEGLDGSGLTTQSERVVDFFRKNGEEAYLTKEPTDNVIGGLIRGALSGVYKLPSPTLQLLFTADRGHHIDREIVPILKRRRVVVCDRYFFSTVAFGSLNVDRNWLLEINKHAIVPDITIFLKVPPRTCIKRIAVDRFDFELYEKARELTQVWKTYEWLARKFDKDVVVVDGVGKREVVFERVIETISKNPKAKRLLKKRASR